MLRSFDSLAVRQLRTRPLRAGLTMFGVMLGVGMVFGVLLLVGTIRHTMDDVMSSALGNSDLIVTPEAGLLPDSTLEDVRAIPGVRDAGGMVGTIVTRLGDDGKPIKTRSAQIMLAAYNPYEFPPYDFRLVDGRRVQTGREIIVERNWARDRGVDIGELLDVAGVTGPAHLQVVGIFKFSSGLSLGGIGLAAMPLLAGRRVMDMPTGWMQVTVAAADRDSEAVAKLERRLEAALPAGIEVQTPQGVSDELKGQLDAMNVVLYFFSGVALFVGAFLILNSFNMTVLQRMRELGMLRTLGASRRMVMRTVLVEALIIGLAGTVLGLGLGIGLAAGLVQLMVGMGMPVGALQVQSGPAIVAAVVGLAVTLAAALWPARRAGRISPMRAILGGSGLRRTARPARALAGVALLVPGAILGGQFWFSSDAEAGGLMAVVGIAMTMAMFLGMALLAPFVIVPFIRAIGVPMRRVSPTGGRLAVDALVSNPMRTAATAAALTIGLSVVVVNSSMSASVKGTINDQIEANFARDFTLQPEGYALETGGGPGVSKQLLARVAALPETRAVTPVRSLITDMPGIDSAQMGMLVGFDPKVYGLMDGSPVRDLDRAQALREVAAGGVLLGASYASAAGLERGDTIALEGPGGKRRARVVGVLDAIAGFAGNTIQMSLATMEQVYGHTIDAQLAVKARSDAQAAALERRLEDLLTREYPNLELQSASGAKQEIAAEIDAQFNLFNGIVAIAVIVSLLGVINTLAMSVLERTREIGVLRALGASRWKVRRTMFDESVLITVAGALTGVAFGVVIGWFWIRGLGSVMPGIGFHFPSGTVVTVAVAAIVLGTLAAILPARRAARLDVLDALKYE